MSQAIGVLPRLSPDEYLAMELASSERYEYVGGQIYLMSGTSANHGRLVRRLAHLIEDHLEGHACEVFTTDFKLRVAPEVFYYPDVLVCCDEIGGGQLYAASARVVVEVASPSTRRTDQNEKSAAYWGLPSVDVYVLIEQDLMAIEVRRRAADGWQTELITEPTDLLRLESICFSAPLSAIYARTDIGGATQK